MNKLYENCNLCPRKCGINRSKKLGYCNSTNLPKLARAALHFWEEPCISGVKGSGTVFFSGCSLKCCFCQNHEISHEGYGKEISVERLSEIFLELQQQGAHNINLVNPTHFVPSIIEALDLIKNQLTIPVVYNCGGYEAVETIELLNGYIDIYLPDFKYQNDELSLKYSKAPNYSDTALTAIIKMYEQVGAIKFDDNGIMLKGVIIRHLLLPCCHNDSIAIMHKISNSFNLSEIIVSVMSQYTPCYQSSMFKEINRKVYTYEYKKVLECIDMLNINGFMQDKASAISDYTPVFNLYGI